MTIEWDEYWRKKLDTINTYEIYKQEIYTEELLKIKAMGDKIDEFRQLIIKETGITNPRVIVEMLNQYLDIKTMVHTVRYEPEGMYRFMRKLFDKTNRCKR